MNASELTGEAARGAERLLAPLSAEARDLVGESFAPVAFPFGAVIVREGEEPDGVYMLAEGSARVVKNGIHGGEVSLRSLGPGDWFGALAVLDHAPRQASVRASDEVVAWRLERQLFLALLHSHPEVRSSFEALAHRHAWRTSCASTPASRRCRRTRSTGSPARSSEWRSRPATSSCRKETRRGRCT